MTKHNWQTSRQVALLLCVTYMIASCHGVETNILRAQPNGVNEGLRAVNLTSTVCNGVWSISLKDSGAHSLTSFAVEMRFDSGGGVAYNPTLLSTVRRPGELLVFDSKGNKIGDIFSRLAAPRRAPMVGDWSALPTGSFVGRLIQFDRRTIDNLFLDAGRDITNEQYILLQLNVKESFVSASLIKDESEEQKNLKLQNWLRGFETTVCTSNVIRIPLN